MNMKKTIFAISAAVILGSCGSDKNKDKFVINGTIQNNTAKMVYLEKVPAATMEPTLSDSALIGKDGKFKLTSNVSESVVYNLRLDTSRFPIASLINDANEIKINIHLSKENSEFADEYQVEGSPASTQMKEFVVKF